MQSQLTQTLSEQIAARSDAEYRIQLLESELNLFRVNDQRLQRGQDPLVLDEEIGDLSVSSTPRSTHSSKSAPSKSHRAESVRSTPTPRSDRMSKLKTQLKQATSKQAQAAQKQSQDASERPSSKPTLRPSSKQDRKRVQRTADRLKDSIPPQAQAPQDQTTTAPRELASRPTLSEAEQQEHSKRASQTLKDNLRRLSRKRS